MNRKDKTLEPYQSIRAKQLKNNKTKNKQMFTELKTHEQSKIIKFNQNIKSNTVKNPEVMIDEDDENSMESVMQINNSKESQNIEQVCAIVHHLLSKNKISAKNAFEVPFIDLQKLQQFVNISESENGWRRISSTLENDSKIYSYRVDAIHSIAYKIMNTMTRNRDEEPTMKQNQQGQNDKKKQLSQLDKMIIPLIEDQDIKVSAFLEKNKENINLQQLDKFIEFNPTYERTRRRFDQNGLTGMLLNNIPLDRNLQLSLNQMRKVKPVGFYSQAIPVEVGNLDQTPSVFKNIEAIRKNVASIVKQEFVMPTGFEQSWRKITNGQFACEKNSLENNSNEMDVQMQQQRVETNTQRKVQDAIKFKTKQKPVKTTNDMAQESLTWLSQMDKKMLGIKTNTNQAPIQTLKKNNPIRQDKNQDDIQFDINKPVQKQSVYTEQTMQKQKNQLNQQIQQKHLLPIRLNYKFKVQQVMTLREEPVQLLQNIQIEQMEEYQIQQRQQIDIKRQQISIRQSKQKLKSLMLKQTDFKSLCRKFEINERNIASQLCFLTVLHLANENNLRLEQLDEYNFMIKN